MAKGHIERRFATSVRLYVPTVTPAVRLAIAVSHSSRDLTSNKLRQASHPSLPGLLAGGPSRFSATRVASPALVRLAEQ